MTTYLTTESNNRKRPLILQSRLQIIYRAYTVQLYYRDNRYDVPLAEINLHAASMTDRKTSRKLTIPLQTNQTYCRLDTTVAS